VQVGIGLHDNNQHAEALVAFQGFLDYLRRHGAREEDTLCAQTNVANCLWRVGRADESLRIERHVFSASREIFGDGAKSTIMSATNLATTLIRIGRYDEVPPMMRSFIPTIKDKYGPEHELTLQATYKLGLALGLGTDEGEADEGRKLLFDARQIARRVFGDVHPVVGSIAGALYKVLPVPRFAGGTRVECCRGGGEYHKGTVVALHYRDETSFDETFGRGYFAPYQVQLDNKSHGVVPENDEGLIYAQEDHDGCIRAVASDADDNEPATPAAVPGRWTGSQTAYVPDISDDDDATTV